ncbi:MAG: hypothetical protein ABIK15_06685 [Pseudomonadota bacterium]
MKNLPFFYAERKNSRTDIRRPELQTAPSSGMEAQHGHDAFPEAGKGCLSFLFSSGISPCPGSGYRIIQWHNNC